MFSFCKIGGLARVFCQAGCLASANLGGLVPRRAVFSAGSRGLVPFRGEISSLVPAVGRISRFGTRKAAQANRDQAFLRMRGTKSPKLAEIGVPNLEIRHNSGPEPNRGYQTPGSWQRGAKRPILAWRASDPGSRRGTVDCHVQNNEVLQA